VHFSRRDETAELPQREKKTACGSSCTATRISVRGLTTVGGTTTVLKNYNLNDSEKFNTLTKSDSLLPWKEYIKVLFLCTLFVAVCDISDRKSTTRQQARKESSKNQRLNAQKV
jgi:hypothetical protein